MKEKSETLDEYLENLDQIKQQVAERTASLSPDQKISYFAEARRRLETTTGKSVRTRNTRRRVAANR